MPRRTPPTLDQVRRKMAAASAGATGEANGQPPPEDAPPPEPDAADPVEAQAAELAALAARYQPVNWAEAWAAQPDDVQWLVEPLLEAGTVNALFGPPGVGKSLVTLVEIALRLVRGGHTVVYLDEENRVTDLVERLQACGAVPAELARLVMFSFAGLPPLDTPAGGRRLLALAVEHGADLVVLDTTSRMVAGRENDSDTFLQLYRSALVPLKRRGMTVLRLDHPGKDESRGQRGSSAKDGDVDTIWRLTAEGPGELRLERQKSRSGHGDSVVVLRRRFGPLRHEWSCGGVPDLSVSVLNVLNEKKVPISAGRETVRKTLAEAGIKIRNDQLSAIIRQRKSCPGQVGDGGDREHAGACPHTPHIGVGTGDSSGPGPVSLPGGCDAPVCRQGPARDYPGQGCYCPGHARQMIPRAQWAAYGVPDPVPHAAPVSLTGLPPRDPAAPLPAGACRHPGCLAMEMNCLVDTGRCLNCAEPLDADGHDRDACAAELANLGLADDREANP